jgi:hypothetical protein
MLDAPVAGAHAYHPPTLTFSETAPLMIAPSHVDRSTPSSSLASILTYSRRLRKTLIGRERPTAKPEFPDTGGLRA